jgi:hypothetical protein
LGYLKPNTAAQNIDDMCCILNIEVTLDELFQLGFKCKDSRLPVYISELEPDVLKDLFLAADKALEQKQIPCKALQIVFTLRDCLMTLEAPNMQIVPSWKLEPILRKDYLLLSRRL